MSGTAYMYDGHLLTAGHLCDAWTQAAAIGAVVGTELVSPFRLRAVSGNGFVVTGQYIPKRFTYSETQDVCELEATEDGVPGLEDLDRGFVRIGDPVSIVGAPMGLMLYRTEGFVASMADARLNGYMAVSAMAYAGNSGSPVLDSDGNFVGMLIAGMRSYPVISVLMSAEAIDEWLDD